MVISDSKWQQPKCQTWGFRMVVHKAMGDTTVATSTSFMTGHLDLLCFCSNISQLKIYWRWDAIRSKTNTLATRQWSFHTPAILLIGFYSTIFQDLNWASNIDTTISKPLQRIYFLFQLRKLRQELLIQLYTAIIIQSCHQIGQEQTTTDIQRKSLVPNCPPFRTYMYISTVTKWAGNFTADPSHPGQKPDSTSPL